MHRMDDIQREIDAAVLSDVLIAREKVAFWIESTSDLASLAKLYRLTGESYYRIQPELGREKTCELIRRYLLECIRQNVSNREEIEGRWEAARSLHAWFCHLSEQGDCSEELTKASAAVTELFLTSGEEVRAAIEQGFLEHALEMTELRPYFEHWSADPRLQDTWERALEWGKAHPAFTWDLLKQLQKVRDEG